MTRTARWIPLFALAGVVTGVALWLGGDTPTTGPSAAVVARPDALGPARTALPEGVPTDARGTPATPRELIVEPIAGATPAGNDPESGAEARPRVTVVGRLVSIHGRPIPDAFVALLENPVSQVVVLGMPAFGDGDPREHLGIGRATTDADGAFRIEADLPDPPAPDAMPAVLGDMFSDRPRLLVQHEDFVNGDHPVPALFAGEVDAGTLVLSPAGHLVGRVLAPVEGAAPAPVAGARLAARPVDKDGADIKDLFDFLSGGEEQSTANGKTDEEGRFDLGGLPPGEYQLLVRSDDHPRQIVEALTVMANRTTTVGDVLLAEGTVLAGVVVDADGSPVPGLEVRREPGMPAGIAGVTELSTRLMLGDMRETTQTDEQGRFRFEGVDEGVHDLRTGGRRTVWSRADRDDVAGGTLDVELVVHALGELLVTVREVAAGPPLAQTVLDAKRVDDDEVLLPQWSHDHDRTDESLPPGVFLVTGAGREGTDLTARAPGYAPTHLRAPPVLDGSRIALDLLLVPESAIEGIVRDDRGAPVAGADVEASVETGEAGSHTTVRKASQMRNEMLEQLGMGRTKPEKATTDEGGRFRIDGLAAGDWSVSAGAEDFVSSDPQTVSLATAGRVRDLELVLQPGGAVVGRVVEAGGLPVGGARVRIAPVPASVPAEVHLESSGSSATGFQKLIERKLVSSLGLGAGDDRTVRTDPDGRYQTRGLRPGDYTVTLRKQTRAPITLDLGNLLGAPPPDDGRTQRVTVVAREETRVDFVRAPRTTVEVRVTASGTPVEGASVSISDLSSSVFGIDLSLGANVEHTDSDGLARFEDLEPATYVVSATVPGALHMEKDTVELTAGQERRVELGFGGVSLTGRVLDHGDKPVAGISVTLAREETDGPEAGDGFLSSLLGDGNLSITMSVQDDAGNSRTTRRTADAAGLAADRVVTDANGDFQLKHLSPGAWRVSAGGGPWIPGEPVRVTIEEEDPRVPDRITLHVQRGATLTGQVIDGDSEEPLDGVRVELQDVDGERVDRVRSEGGTYRFEGVPAGNWVLLIDGPEGPRARRDVQVGGGAPTITMHLVTRS